MTPDVFLDFLFVKLNENVLMFTFVLINILELGKNLV